MSRPRNQPGDKVSYAGGLLGAFLWPMLVERKRNQREKQMGGEALCDHLSQQSNNPQEARQSSRIKYLVLVPTLGV